MQELYLHAYLPGGGSKFNVLHKANFSLQQRNIFYLSTKFVGNIEKVPPTQSQISIHQPNNLFKQRDEINMIIQEPDTQDVHNWGHG